MPVTSAISTSVLGLKYQIKQTANGGSVFLKNAVTAYSVTGSSGSFIQVTSANYPTTTVPGAVYLDSYMYVQKITGEICNFSTGSILNIGSLDFITPEKEPSCAIAIAKSLNYLAAFKQWDTEFFTTNPSYAPPGSPLTTIDSSYLKLGCATADSIVEFDGGIIFMSKRDQSQRSREIHVLNGLTPKKISTAEIERILNGDNLATCYALYLSTAGHQFYVLTLKSSAITIVYDFNNGLWYQWTFLTAQATKSVTALTSLDTRATATVTNHGYSDGDPVVIAGANQSGYNGTVNISYIDANTFSYSVAAGLTTPATGTITSMGYTESYFPAVAYATYNNLDLILHESNGLIYSLDPSVYDDNGAPINFMVRTPLYDAGNLERKQFVKARLVTDMEQGTAYIRRTDDDYNTYNLYEGVPLNSSAAYEGNSSTDGQARRRAWEVKYTASSTPLRVEALEMDITKGKG